MLVSPCTQRFGATVSPSCRRSSRRTSRSSCKVRSDNKSPTKERLFTTAPTICVRAIRKERPPRGGRSQSHEKEDNPSMVLVRGGDRSCLALRQDCDRRSERGR